MSNNSSSVATATALPPATEGSRHKHSNSSDCDLNSNHECDNNSCHEPNSNSSYTEPNSNRSCHEPNSSSSLDVDMDGLGDRESKVSVPN